MGKQKLSLEESERRARERLARAQASYYRAKNRLHLTLAKRLKSFDQNVISALVAFPEERLKAVVCLAIELDAAAASPAVPADVKQQAFEAIKSLQAAAKVAA